MQRSEGREESDVQAPWHDFAFVVQMPHLAPGEKLSEVEFLKQIAAWQWEAIARMLGCKPSQIVNAQHERLYGSVIDVELHLAERHSMESLGEDAHIRVRNRIRLYAKKFVEGFFAIDDKEIPDSLLATVKTRDDLRALPLSWACMTNAFIARTGGNLKLKVFKPAGIDDRAVDELKDPPPGIQEQARVQGGGEIEPLGATSGPAILLRDRHPERILYPIVPESDLNGAGLVYFARYESMMNYGERIFLSQHLERPVSSEFVSYLSTEHRKAYFFANASPTDLVHVDVAASLLPPGSFAEASTPLPYRVPMKFLFRVDLYRASDNVLMASSLVRKALHVPGNAKSVLLEAQRLLLRLQTECERAAG
jgi:probable biosynthetic protein (TIGR04098 family)